MADTRTAIAPVQLIGDGLLLRPYRAEDASALHAAVQESVDSVAPWLTWCHAGYAEADAAAWIAHCADAWASGDQYTFAVFDAATAQFLGAAGLTHCACAANFAGLGYWVRESARGRGIAVRAGKRVVAFGFDTLRLARVEILAAVDNAPSRRTAEQIGARFEGIARNRLLVARGIADAAVYALIPSDYADAQMRATSS